MRLSVVGLGKLGACTAACFAAKGFEVLGVDVIDGLVEALNRGRAPFPEPGLAQLLEASRGRLRAVSDCAEAIARTDATFLVVPTPSEPGGRFSDRYLRQALESLAAALARSDKPYHLFVVTSTVSPGTLESVLIPLIERVSGRRLNLGFGVCYNPEFIALGSVVRDFLNPDLVLIGQSSPQAGEALARVYAAVCENQPAVARMSLVSAELAKLALNAFVTMKISFANTLAGLCEALPGADVDAVAKALGADRRVSPHYLRGGLPFGGPCFPRDARAFAALARERGVADALARATDEVNAAHMGVVAAKVLGQLAAARGGPVAVLGLAYKPGTPVIEESPSLKLVERLLERGLEVLVYDPLALETARGALGARVGYAASARECLEASSLCVVMTQEKEFAALDARAIRRAPATFIDCWRILDAGRLGPQARVLPLGRFGREDVPAAS